MKIASFGQSFKNMESGFNIVRNLKIPSKFKTCNRNLKKVNINYNQSQKVDDNGKVDSHNTLVVKEKCHKEVF